MKLIDNDVETSLWFVVIIGSDLVHSHVHGDKDQEQRRSNHMIVCELSVLEICARRHDVKLIDNG